MPQVMDPSFFRSVVLLLHHEEDGSLGLIVNRPTESALPEILEELEITDWQGDEEAVAHFGGPVQQQLGSVLFLGRDGEPLPGEATTEVLPGVGLTHHVGDLEHLAGSPPEHLRLFLGYAAWGEGQLMEEILRNDWITAPVDLELIFTHDAEEIWERAVRSVGMDPASLPSWTAANSNEAEAN